MTIELVLKNDFVALIDECDLELVSEYKWFAAFTGRGHYVMTCPRIGGKKTTLYMHRLIIPDAETIDHINNNGLDNRRENLRPCTIAQNSWNRGPKSGRRYKGVSQRFRNGVPVGGWYALITVYGKQYYLGAYTTEEKAARAYDYVARIFFGEFAKLNFPGEGENDFNASAKLRLKVADIQAACGMQPAIPFARVGVSPRVLTLGPIRDAA